MRTWTLRGATYYGPRITERRKPNDIDVIELEPVLDLLEKVLDRDCTINEELHARNVLGDLLKAHGRLDPESGQR